MFPDGPVDGSRKGLTSAVDGLGDETSALVDDAVALHDPSLRIEWTEGFDNIVGDEHRAILVAAHQSCDRRFELHICRAARPYRKAPAQVVFSRRKSGVVLIG